MRATTACRFYPSKRAGFFRLIAAGLLLPLFAACSSKPDAAANKNTPPASRASSADLVPAQIIERNRALDDSRDSTARLRARVTDSDAAELHTPKQILLTMYRKHETNGQILILVEFTAPAEERDRDGLITILQDGRLEAIRYVQSTDTFITTDDPSSEDSLFGLTLQELADGQPEKYEFTLVGEEAYEGTPVYRLDGKLKVGGQSKFPRLVLLIEKQNFTARQAEFYDNHNQLARRLTVSKIEQIDGHWTRTRWTIDNRARQKSIDFEALDVRYDQNLGGSIFTREHLKRIASR